MIINTHSANIKTIFEKKILQKLIGKWGFSLTDIQTEGKILLKRGDKK